MYHTDECYFLAWASTFPESPQKHPEIRHRPYHRLEQHDALDDCTVFVLHGPGLGNSYPIQQPFFQLLRLNSKLKPFIPCATLQMYTTTSSSHTLPVALLYHLI